MVLSASAATAVASSAFATTSSALIDKNTAASLLAGAAAAAAATVTSSSSSSNLSLLSLSSSRGRQEQQHQLVQQARTKVHKSSNGQLSAVSVTNSDATSSLTTSSSTTAGTARALFRSIYKLWYAKVPPFLRYTVSGNLGNIGVYYCEQCVYHMLGGGDKLPLLLLPPDLMPHLDTISFFLGYLLAVPSQHLLHALLVYGLKSINTVEKYKTTLLGMYSALITACIGSTILNSALLKYTSLPKGGAFITTMLTFSLFNYFVIGWIIQRSNSKASAHENSTSTTVDLSELTQQKQQQQMQRISPTISTRSTGVSFLVRSGTRGGNRSENVSNKNHPKSSSFNVQRRHAKQKL